MRDPILTAASVPETEVNRCGKSIQLDGLTAEFRLGPDVSALGPEEKGVRKVEVQSNPCMYPVRNFRRSAEASEIAAYFKFREISADAGLAVRLDRPQRD